MKVKNDKENRKKSKRVGAAKKRCVVKASLLSN